MSQANLKIVESTLAGMAEKEKEKETETENWKRKEKSSDKEIEVEKEKGMKSGGSLKGESYLSLMREGEPRGVLCCAVLCCAVLCCAVLCCAVLCCAVLCCAVLCCAVLCCAALLSSVSFFLYFQHLPPSPPFILRTQSHRHKLIHSLLLLLFVVSAHIYSSSTPYLPLPSLLFSLMLCDLLY